MHSVDARGGHEPPAQHQPQDPSLIGRKVVVISRIVRGRVSAKSTTSATSSAVIIASSIVMWLLLTVVATALAQQPKVRRLMQKEITDYKANAEMQALAAELAAERAAAGGSTADKALSH